FAAFAQFDTANFSKVAVIYSDLLFEEKSSVKVLAEAYQKIDEKIKGAQKQLDVLSLRIESLKKELQNLQNSPTIFQRRLGELELLQREYNFRREEIGSLPRKHKSELMISFKVYEALLQFKKQKGYAIILDRSEIRDSSMVIEGNEKFMSVTPDFIQFYTSKYVKAETQ
ncbi:MAG TPA: OmpH family outer membrane protein, partial [Pyrinomonadaceae bacterium]